MPMPHALSRVLLAALLAWIVACPARAEEGGEAGAAEGVAESVAEPAAEPAAEPTETEDPLTRAWAAWTSGDTETALAASEEAVEAREDEAYPWVLRAYLLSRAGRKAEAADAYARARELDPRDPLVLNNHGAVLLALGRTDEARGAFSQALELRPGYADAQNNLGAVLERLGRRDEAEAAYRIAAETDPEHATAHNNLGAIALRQGRVEEARRSFKRASELDPSLGAPVLNLLIYGGGDIAPGDVFDRLQAAALAAGAPASVRARALAALAGRATRAKDFAEARRLYLEALALTPEDPSLLNNLAVAEDQLGLDRDAMLHLEAALQLRPFSLVARNNMGIVHVHRGQYNLARDVFTELIDQDANFHRAHYNLGIVQAAEGRLDDALRSFENAARLAPQDAEVRYNLGLLRRRMGGSEAEERRAYEQALDLDPGLAEAHLQLGCFLADPQTSPQLRNEDRARVHLTRFLELALPTDVEGIEQAEAWLEWLDERR